MVSVRRRDCVRVGSDQRVACLYDEGRNTDRSRNRNGQTHWTSFQWVLTSIEEVPSGTGRFAGATGALYNNATDVNSVFHSNISGQLCFAGEDGGGDGQ